MFITKISNGKANLNDWLVTAKVNCDYKQKWVSDNIENKTISLYQCVTDKIFV